MPACTSPAAMPEPGPQQFGDAAGNVRAESTTIRLTLGYALKPWARLRLGYRSLNFNSTAADSLEFNVHMKGPLAASFRF